MERITVTLGERSYPITIAAGLFNDPASFLPLKAGDQAMLVTNETLAPLYLDRVRHLLEQAGVKVYSGEDALYTDSLGGPDSPASTYLAATVHNTEQILDSWGATPSELPDALAEVE